MKKNKTSWIVHIVFILFSLMCIIPLMIIVSASFSSVESISYHGFSVWPKEFDLSAYRYLFETPSLILNGYAVTIFITVVGTFLAVMVMSMAGYALSRPNCIFKNILNFYIYFTTLFSGGLTSSYIINTKYLGFVDNIWVMIIPGLVSVMHVFMLRTFFKQLPDGLFDAAKIDGASEIRIYFSIALTLSKPVVATVAFLGALGRWNEWNSAMLYIRTPEKRPLQYILQRMMMNIQELLDSMNTLETVSTNEALPGENLRMALLVVCIGPVMFFFPFFQKYFTKGMTVGAVKG